MAAQWIESERAERLLPWLLAAATLVAYLPSLSGGFLNYDDPWLIEQNSLLADSSPSALLRIWLDLSTSTRLILGAEYLPLRDTSLWIEARLYGLHPLPLRLVNFGFYLGAVLWLRLALLRSPLPRSAVEVAAWLFALHPLHVESVAWLAGRKDVLALFFGSWALASHATASPKARWQTPLLILAAMLSKSLSAVLPLLLLAHDLLHKRRPNWRSWFLCCTAVAVTMGIHVLVGSRVHMVDEPLGGSRWAAWVTMGPVWLRYLWSFVCPASLSIVHDVPLRSSFDALSLGGYAVLAAGGVAGLWFWHRRKPWLLFAWLWLVVPLVPTSQVLVPLQNTMADRYAMLSVLSFCLVVGLALHRLERWPSAFATLSLLILTFYGAATWQRSALFADSAALFADAAQKAPLSATAHYQLGHALEARYDLEGAKTAYEAALRGEPSHGEVQRRATNNLARVLVKLHLFAEAEAVLERGRGLWPDDPKILSNLVKVVARRGDETRAKSLYLELRQRFPGHFDDPEPTE